MRPYWSPFAVASAVLTLASPLRAQAPESPRASVRFRDPASITGDPTGLRQIVPFPFRELRYPDRARADEHTAAPVVAFVVDTMGRVELSTASFLNDVEPEFQRSICRLLPSLRFEPLVIASQKMRVLLVQFYGFNTLTKPDGVGLALASALMHERQEAYATQPVENVIPELESRPHCDDPRGK
jgi:hypothetical protein